MSGYTKVNLRDDVDDMAQGRMPAGIEAHFELGRLDAIRMDPDTMRALKAGPDGCELIAYGAPKTAGTDAEMVAGWWEE